ncbi:HSPB1-associated protein 1 [Phlebotomus argentipes]|uniref:HSPB1-associated protein 1 n=1 Tax=Phlebotomus argentipes TaxID=94469 RepID=UPI002892B615|nr:HSPB1-associated protein 1 [Phlebotomus argentipes]
MSGKITPQDLSKIAQNVENPCVIRNFGVPWASLGSNLAKWCEKVDQIYPEGVSFEKASQKHGSEPQWECFREKTPRMTLKSFLMYSSTDNWLSYGYKSLRDLPEGLKEDIDFSPLGFPEIKDDATLWLGTRAAHTSCHYDTYGRNIVVQVFGHKRWILFSPEVDLQATRIPFEESSVYSGLNFFSPRDLGQFDSVKKLAHIVTLAPGDVLIVPPRWWHFVENLDTALAINAWIPIKEDIDHQISECFVKSIIVQFLRDVDCKIKKFLVNPNEMEVFEEDPKELLEQHVKILNYLRNLKRSKSTQKNKFSEEEWEELLERNSVEIVQKSTEEEFLEILNGNMKRHDESWNIPDLSEEEQLLINQLTEFINSLTDAEAISKMKKQYLKIS